MSMIEGFLLKVRKAETPFYARLKSAGKSVMLANVDIPAPVLSIYKLFSFIRLTVRLTWSQLAIMLYRAPTFRSRCVSVGKDLSIERIPYVVGAPRIHIGNNVRISGVVKFAGGRTFDNPEIVIGNDVFIGNRTTFIVAKQIIVEDGVGIAAECLIADNDGHPLDAESRLKGLPPSPHEVKPVRICRNAWLSHGCYVLKGVTIGEGAVIGVSSVVMSDIPPFCVAMGNPARVVQRLKG